jgi:glutamate-1-semialdehyde 2,1-aminomutase
MAVIDTYREEDVIRVLHARGELLRERATSAIAAAGVSDHVQVLGRSSNLIFTTLDADRERSQPFRTLFLQELLRRGVIAPSFVVSAALSEEDVDHTVGAVHEACVIYRRALDEGVDRYLDGRPVKPALRPYA